MAVAGMAKISPFEVVKRTSVPVLVGLVIVIVATEILVPATIARLSVTLLKSSLAGAFVL